MTDLRSFIAALKISWVKRALITTHPWEVIARHILSVGDTNFVWDKGSSFMKYLSSRITNLFWKEVTNSWGIFVSKFQLEDLTMGSISLWRSDYTKYKTDDIGQWAHKGLLHFNDLRTSSGELMTFAEAKHEYNLPGTFLDYAGLLNSLPRAYVMTKGKIEAPIIPDQIKYLLGRDKGTKHIYNRLTQCKILLNIGRTSGLNSMVK